MATGESTLFDLIEKTNELLFMIEENYSNDLKSVKKIAEDLHAELDELLHSPDSDE